MVHKVDFIQKIGSFIHIFVHSYICGSFLGHQLFLCLISDLVLRLPGIFPHTLEDTALFVCMAMP